MAGNVSHHASRPAAQAGAYPGDAMNADGPTTGDEGGDPVCWLNRVCPDCGLLTDEEPPLTCPRCGATIPGPDD
jgi:rubrerythrin